MFLGAYLGVRFILSVAVVLGGAGISVAQEPAEVPVFSGSGWQVQCANNGTDLDCAIVQQIVRADAWVAVAALTLRLPAETGVPVMMVQLPLGIAVTAPVTLQVDDGVTESVSLQTCTVAGCFAGLQVPEPLLAGMQSGTQLLLGFQGGDEQPVIMAVPLAGFTIAYGKLQ